MDDVQYLDKLDFAYQIAGFQDQLFSFVDSNVYEYNLRELSLVRLAHADRNQKKYRDYIVSLIDFSKVSQLNEVALRAAHYYKELDLTSLEIEYIEKLIYEECSKNPQNNYSLYYTSNSAKNKYGNIHTMFYSIAASGTDNAITYLDKIIRAGSKSIHNQDMDTVYSICDFIKLLGKEKNHNAIPISEEIYDSYSYDVNNKKDVIKLSVLIGLSNFDNETICSVIEPRYRDYLNKYDRFPYPKVKSKIEKILRCDNEKKIRGMRGIFYT